MESWNRISDSGQIGDQHASVVVGALLTPFDPSRP